MAINYPNLTRTQVTVELDVTDSNGQLVHPVDWRISRPMALSIGIQKVWYEFVLNDLHIDRVLPGQSVSCDVSFLDHEGAKMRFHRGASVIFGDGAATKGVIRVISFDSNQ
ncbi:MAG: hypothetical protein ACREPD_15525 [Stenotrophomonas sp.]|uniref:hypothetical protein n=1 Tax=Stenotrophomonas sp. TaxID=69392 RepID=UPI003D6D4D16